VAALLEEAENPAPASAAGQVSAQAAAQASQFSTTGEMIKARMPDLVKGAGLASQGGNTVLTDQSDILTRSAQAALDIRSETYRGFTRKSEVVKSMSPSFLSQFGYLRTALEMPSVGEQLQNFMSAVATPDVVRSFTAGNLGIGSVYGNTPFNLLAP
jgi:hypothetical protein